RVGICAVLALDTIAPSMLLNPQVDASALAPPAWVRAAASEQGRVYVGGHASALLSDASPDHDALPFATREAPDVPYTVMKSGFESRTLMMPSPWKARDAISLDSQQLWPHEFWDMLRLFNHSSRAAQFR